MTRNELLALATKAGVMPVNRAHLHLEPIWWSVTAEDLDRFAALVAAHEREACALICEKPHWKIVARNALQERAAEIRARGDAR